MVVERSRGADGKYQSEGARKRALGENTEARLERINNEIADSVGKLNALIMEWAQTAQVSLIDLQRRIALEALSRIVRRTPVDTGRARGNWQLTIGELASEDVTLVGADDFDRAGKKRAIASAVIQEGRERLKKLGFGEIVWVSNNLDYVAFLEDGSSKQAPRGMVKVTLSDLEAMFR